MTKKTKVTAAYPGSWKKKLGPSFRANNRFKKKAGAGSSATPGIEDRYGVNRQASQDYHNENIKDNIKSTGEQLDSTRLALRPDLKPPPGMTLQEYRAQLRRKRRESGPRSFFVKSLSRSAIGKAIAKGMAKSPKWAAHKRKIAKGKTR
jgi:hypothetical protein